MATYNLLEGENQTFQSSSGDWVADSPHAILFGGERRKYPKNGSLQILPGDTSDVTLTSPAVSAPEGWDGLNIRVFAWFWSPVAILITPTLTFTSGGTDVDVAGVQKSVPAEEWTFIDVTGQYVHTEEKTVSFSFLIEEHLQEVILMTYPVVTNTDLPALNAFARQAYLRMPEYMREADALQEYPNFPLYRFLDVCSYHLGEIIALWDRFRAVPLDVATDDLPAQTSDLVDPQTCEISYLPWLAGLLGFRLRNPATGLSSWTGLQETLADWLAWQTDIDTSTVDTYDSPEFSAMSRNAGGTTVTATIGNPHAVEVGDWINISGATPSSFNGDFEVTGITSTDVTWAQTGTGSETASVRGTLTLYDTDWSELEAFATAISNPNDYLRAQVQYAFFGLGAGKKETLEEIAKTVLDPTLVTEPQVKVIGFYGGDEWAIRVYVVDSELLSGADPTEGLQASAPAGYEVTFQAVSQATFDGL